MLALGMAMINNTEAQEEKKPVKGYGFEIVKSVEHTNVKSQDKTGTCWCFAGASFIESELIRQGHGKHNFSEMAGKPGISSRRGVTSTQYVPPLLKSSNETVSLPEDTATGSCVASS